MKEKDKAKELVEKYKSHTAWWDYYWDVEIEDSDRIQKAKPMALICVDEIIEAPEDSKEYVDDNSLFEFNNKVLKYWQAVKTEIEAL